MTTRGLFNFLRTGYYFRASGNIIVRTTRSLWWNDAIGNRDTDGAFSLGLGSDPGFANPQGDNARGNGFAIRVTSLRSAGQRHPREKVHSTFSTRIA